MVEEIIGNEKCQLVFILDTQSAAHSHTNTHASQLEKLFSANWLKEI